jgi:hypothetical protein
MRKSIKICATVLGLMAFGTTTLVIGYFHGQRAALALVPERLSIELKQLTMSLEFQERSNALYEEYLRGDPATQLAAMKKLIAIMEAADRDLWNKIDWNITASQSYARASMAAARVGQKADSEEYRRLAVNAYVMRKDWNDAYQQSFPITPSPDYRAAEAELFGMIDRMDAAMIKSKERNLPNKALEPTSLSVAPGELSDADLRRLEKEIRIRKEERDALRSRSAGAPPVPQKP